VVCDNDVDDVHEKVQLNAFMTSLRSEHSIYARNKVNSGYRYFQFQIVAARFLGEVMQAFICCLPALFYTLLPYICMKVTSFPHGMVYAGPMLMQIQPLMML
jgi:hypothetical protein